MSDRYKIYTDYNDLLAETTDPELAHIIADVETVCTAPQVPNTVSWQQLRMLHVQQSNQQYATQTPLRTSRTPAQSWWYQLTRRTVLVPIIVVFFLGTTAFTFAATPLLQNLLQGNSANLSNPVKYSTFGDINLTQKIGNTSISLEKGYADANNIVLGVTATPVGADMMLQNAKLTTQDGKDISDSGNSLGETEGQMLAESLTFNNSSITGNPSSLNLTLTTDLVQNAQTLGKATFNFVLPYHQAEIIAPKISATSQGKTITLEQVYIGKTETHLDFTGIDHTRPDANGHSNFPQSALQVASSTKTFNFDSAGTDDQSNPFSFRYNNDFSQNHGPWTITITQGTYTWIFHFDA